MKTPITFFAILALLTGCGVLKPVKDRSMNHVLNAAASQRAITGNSPVIAVARPALPGYLDRQQLVTRKRDGTIMMNQNQLWAEPLDEGIARVTAENLGRMRNSHNIQPVQAFITMDYSHLLEVRISRFDANEQTRTIILECTWRLQPVSGHIATSHPFRTELEIDDTRFSASSSQMARVDAMNQALLKLAAAITSQL